MLSRSIAITFYCLCILSMPCFAGSDIIEIKSNGKLFKVHDFFKDAGATTDKYGTCTLRSNDRYFISYFKEGKFVISISGMSNLDRNRKEAEHDFLSLLQVTKEQACKINPDVFFPAMHGKSGGPSFRLSFCPGSKSSPTDL